MRGLRGWALYAVALAVAAALAVATGAGEASDAPVPSVDNTSGAGTRALFLYLRESGFDVDALRTPLTGLTSDVRTVVLSAPTARQVKPEEIASLETFAKDGGTVVLLTPPGIARTQPELAEWLGIEPWPRDEEPAPKPGDLTGPDAFGVSVPVELRQGPLAGVASFRIGQGRPSAVSISGRPAIPVASYRGTPAMWWLPMGRGELLVGVPDIAENRRIELDDNLAFWSALASRGPLRFDEFHHAPEGGPPMSRGLVAFSVQLLAFFAFFAFARGARLGPARPEQLERHRSTREYLDAFAWLTRRARVEGALLRETHARFRILLQERLGIPPAQPDEEVALELERQCQIPRDSYLDTVRELRAALSAGDVSPREFARTSRALARIERVVRGR